MMSPLQALEAMWVKRAADYRKEILPYLGYMGQSGFLLVLSFIAITSGFGYIKLLRDVPPDFPFTLVGVIALVPVLCWSPLRTWLVPADIVFHLPLEARMDHYLFRSFRRSLLLTILLAGLVLLLYWPLYRHGDGLAGGWWLLLFAAALRAVNTWGAWRERLLAWPGMRVLLRLLRWLATAAGLAAMLSREPWMAAVFGVLIFALLAIVYRIPARHALPWERLIEEEARTRRTIYLFFGLFIDVPSMASRSTPRRYLSWALSWIRYRHANTFVYLYAASLIRTELGGIIVRLGLLSALIVYWFAEAVWLDGWGAAAAYAVLMLIIAVQLGGLRRVHSFTVWRHVYPLPDAKRTESIVRVDSRVLAIIAFLVWLPAGITLLIFGYTLPAVIAPVIMIAYALFLRPGRMTRKIVREDDEE
ncbi:ABC transporter permease [Paenibacillus gorillae]|uniref:ABC transporter permease n=1 Tax=Paenibacillus gorillae TaxID=1243662 RepID=UPI0005AB3A53|nr:ABC transporter permease [Paenibacillus gorillae]